MSDRLTLFVVPSAMLGELTTLSTERVEALWSSRDDCQVLTNQLHRRADEVALARVILTEQGVQGGFVAVLSFVRAKVWKTMAKGPLTPEDCRELARKLAEVRERVPSEDVLVRRMFRYKMGVVEPEDVRRGLYALRQALEQACALEAGLLWVSYEEGAEDKLAEVRRADAARREAMAREPPLPPEELEQRRREFDEEMRRIKEDNDRRILEAWREAERTAARTTRRALYAVSAEQLAELSGRRPGRRAGLPKARAFDAAVAERALACATFEHPDERGALEVLLRGLHIHERPRRTWAVRIHDPADTVRLARALADWIEWQRGPYEPAEGVSILAHGADPALCAQVFEGVRALFTEACDCGAGVILTTFVDKPAAAPSGDIV